MPSDSEIRDRFLEGTQPKGQIDVDAVLRRSRGRRRPRVVIAAAGSVLAIAAIAVPALLTSYGSSSGSDTALVAGEDYAPEASSGAAGGADAALSRAPAEKLNLCTATLAEVAPADNGLVISAQPVSASATDTGIPVVVTMTNTGSEQVTGTTASMPALTLSRDGITLWHSNGPHDMMAVVVDLAPGASLTYSATFEPLVCGVEDDSAESFRTDLPFAGPGVYQLSAAIDLTSDDGSAIDLITGPTVGVTLN